MPEPDGRALTSDGRPGRAAALAGWPAAVAGLVLVGVAFAADPTTARAATAQVWSPFVLVGGLILIGLVADEDGLFATLGHRLAAVAPNGPILFGGAAVLVAGVTAVLNLDTAVVFLTPVLVYAARSRGSGAHSAPDPLHPRVERRKPAPSRLQPHQLDRPRPPPSVRWWVRGSHGAALGGFDPGDRSGHRCRRTPPAADHVEPGGRPPSAHGDRPRRRRRPGGRGVRARPTRPRTAGGGGRARCRGGPGPHRARSRLLMSVRCSASRC